MPTTTTEPFSLQPDREAALWEAVEFLNIDPQASALTITRGVLALAMDPHRATAFGAACELRSNTSRRPWSSYRDRRDRPPLPLFDPTTCSVRTWPHRGGDREWLTFSRCFNTWRRDPLAAADP